MSVNPGRRLSVERAWNPLAEKHAKNGKKKVRAYLFLRLEDVLLFESNHHIESSAQWHPHNLYYPRESREDASVVSAVPWASRGQEKSAQNA